MKEKALAERAVELARKAGAAQSDAWLEVGRESSVRVRDGEVEDLTEATSRGLGLRVVVEERLGFAYGSDLSPAGLATLGEQAVALARAAAPDASNVLPSAAELAARNPPLALLDPKVVELSTEWKIEAAKTMERVGRAADKRIQRFESVGAASFASLVAFASSEGVSDAAQASYVMLYAAPVGEQDGQLQVGSWSDQKRFLEDLQSPEEIGRIAAQRAVRMLGATQGPTARLPVVFEPSIAASFLGGMLGAIDGNLVLKGASFLRDKLGAAIGPGWLSVDDDGLYPRGLGSSPFDGEGLATRKQPLLENGVLKTFLYDSRTAAMARARSTHTASRGYRGLPGIGTTTVVARAATSVPRQDLFKGITRGLYVTSMLGRGADAVTGDYSRGANGLLIENGELGRPVQEITVAGNLLEMLGLLEAAGDDLEFHGSLGAPSLRFRELSIAGS